MADSDKNIVITPQTSQTADPSIQFKSGATSGDPITLNVTDDGTTSSLSFEGSAGQLFSISNDLTGTIFGVADASGIPIIEADANGDVRIGEFGGVTTINDATYATINLTGIPGEQNLLIGSGSFSVNAKNNTIIGIDGQAGTQTVRGCYNVGLGTQNYGFGTNAPLTGSYNVAVGANTAQGLSAGSRNVMIGQSVMSNGVAIGGCTCGSDNVAIGGFAGYNHVRATGNTLIGLCTGYAVECSGGNIFIGNWVGRCIESTAVDSASNVIVGSYAACGSISGNCNVALGACAYQTGGGLYNFAAGHHSMQVVTGCDNISIGRCSSCLNTTGCYNIALGVNSFKFSVTGEGNINLGLSAGCCSNGGNYNVHLGHMAGWRQVAGSCNILIGLCAGAPGSEINGNNNIMIGTRARASVTAGMCYAIAIGECAGTSCDFVAIGGYAGTASTTAYRNVAIGTRAGAGGGNYCDAVYIGYEAGRCIFDEGSTRSTFVGACAGWSLRTQSLDNVAFGMCALHGDALGGTMSGAKFNTAIGTCALLNMQGSNCCNVSIGWRAASTLTGGSNNILLGTCAVGSTATVSNEITLGNSAHTVIRANVTSITSLSDQRDKDNIEDLHLGMSFIEEMRPVKFRWNRRDGSSEHKVDIGFIAQELEELELKHGVQEYTQLVYKNNPEKLETNILRTYPILIRAIKELSQKVRELENRLNI